VKGKPYSYQVQGVDWALGFYERGNHGVLIGDDMGLGKTIQALELINKTDPLSVMVVCPSSAKINWQREAQKWLAEPRTMHTLNGRGAEPITPGFRLMTIVNYDILADLDWSQCEYDLIIYDEAHRMKTPDARRTTAAAQIVAHRRLLLTGTPIINRPKEIWQLMVLCGVADPKDFHAFGLKFCGARIEYEFRSRGSKKNGTFKTERVEKWNYDGATNMEELNYWLREKFMIRRLKKDVLPDLPPKTRQIVELPREGKTDLGALDRLLPMYYASREYTEYDEHVGKLDDDIQVAFEEISLVRHETALEKLPQVIEFIENALESSNKIVVFAHHRDVIVELMDHFIAHQHPGTPVCLVGGMSETAKQSSVDSFQNDPSCRLFIGNIAAAGEAITLTAASHVVFAELDWTPAGMSQCEDRCHRIGQKDNVFVQHLVYENSIDCRIAKTLVKKQKIIDSSVDGATSGAIDWLSELSGN